MNMNREAYTVIIKKRGLGEPAFSTFVNLLGSQWLGR